MACEIEVLEWSRPLKAVDSGLTWNLCPSVSSPPTVVRPPLDRLRSCFHTHKDSLLQIRNKRRCFRDEALKEVFLCFLPPVRTEMIRDLVTEAEGAFPLWGMGGVDL